MGVEHKILKYVIDEYGLERHPCFIPKNQLIYRDKETKRVLVEFFIERKRDFNKAPLIDNGKEDNWVLNTYDDNSIIVTEIRNEEKYKEIVDDFLSKISIFAPIVREKRINRVLCVK